MLINAQGGIHCPFESSGMVKGKAIPVTGHEGS
jgi:hypothetical protein